MPFENVFVGANGTLSLATEEGPEGESASTIIGQDVYDLATVGRVTDVQICVKTDVVEYYEVGRRHPVTLHGGRIAISGKVGRAYVNGALLFLLLGQGARPTHADEPYVQPRFTLKVSLRDLEVPDNTASIEVRGVKFENWAYNLAENDFVLENVTFKAAEVSVIDSAPAAPGGDANA